jgi:hypothetical protein
MSDTPVPPVKKKKSKRVVRKAPLTRSSRYGDLDATILTHVIQPQLNRILGEGVTSINDLTEKFRKRFNSGVSLETMKSWLDSLGYAFQKPQIALIVQNQKALPQPFPPGIHVSPVPTPGLPATSQDEPTDPRVTFDNEAGPDLASGLIPGMGGVPRTAALMAQQERLTGFAPDFAPPR